MMLAGSSFENMLRIIIFTRKANKVTGADGVKIAVLRKSRANLKLI